MASLITLPGKVSPKTGKLGKTSYLIQFIDATGKRCTIRPGVDKTQTKSILQRVEKLVAASIAGEPPDANTAQWLAKEASPDLLDKLAAPGVALIPER